MVFIFLNEKNIGVNLHDFGLGSCLLQIQLFDIHKIAYWDFYCITCFCKSSLLMDSMLILIHLLQSKTAFTLQCWICIVQIDHTNHKLQIISYLALYRKSLSTLLVQTILIVIFIKVALLFFLIFFFPGLIPILVEIIFSQSFFKEILCVVNFLKTLDDYNYYLVLDLNINLLGFTISGSIF